MRKENSNAHQVGEDVVDEMIRWHEKQAMKKPSDDNLTGAIQFLEEQAMKNQDAKENANDKASEPKSPVTKAGLFGSSASTGNEHAAQVGQQQEQEQSWSSWLASKLGY